MSTIRDCRVGTLVIFDHFKAKNGSATHGEEVVLAAVQDGYDGPIAAFEHHSCLDAAELGRRRRRMEAPLVSKEQFLQQVGEYVSYLAITTVRAANEDLRDLLEGGWNHCAVNISMGRSKVSLVNSLIKTALDSPLYQNLLSAFDLGQALAREASGWDVQYAIVRQKLAEQVSLALDQSQELQQATTEYAQAVSELAEQEVTVVVAAGNDADANRNTVPPGRDAFDNVLSVPGVLTVGAPAAYSNPSPDVRILASGDLGKCRGTSFAAPRVAAACARLYAENPEADQEQIEAILFRRSHPPTPEHAVPLLDWSEFRLSGT